jgi:hypothetical protein
MHPLGLHPGAVRRDDPQQRRDRQLRPMLRHQASGAQPAATIAAVARDLQHGEAVGDPGEGDNAGGQGPIHFFFESVNGIRDLCIRASHHLKWGIHTPEEPSMPRQTSSTHAARVQLMADAYIPVSGDDPEDFATDLLANLQHWAAANRVPFGASLMRVRRHFTAEQIEEGLRR